MIVEIVRPGTGDPLPAGEVGEVVVTTFNASYPLIRFGTGDLSMILPESLLQPSACGRSNLRIKGWLGRADQTAKVRGMFVHPEQIAQVQERHGQIGRARLVITNPDSNDAMTLYCEGVADDALSAAVAASVRELTKLRGEVVFVAPGSLANDGKIIDDRRQYN